MKRVWSLLGVAIVVTGCAVTLQQCRAYLGPIGEEVVWQAWFLSALSALAFFLALTKEAAK